MMKAIKVLNTVKENIKDVKETSKKYDSNSEYFDATYKIEVDRIEYEVDKAITELKAINNSSCYDCIHCIDINKSYKKCKLLEINVDEDFYCKYWEEDNV